MSILKAIGLTLAYIVLINLAGLWPWPLEENGIRWHLEYYNLIQGIAQLAIVSILLFGILRGKKEVYFKNTESKWFLFAVLAGIGFVLLQSPLNWFYNSIFSEDYTIGYDFDGLEYLTNPNLISTVFLIPIGEELFFRGYIQGQVLSKTKPYLALIVAALLFALIHAPYENLMISSYQLTWHQCYMAFFGGIVSGFIYLRTQSVVPSIVFHAAWNLFVTLI